MNTYISTVKRGTGREKDRENTIKNPVSKVIRKTESMGEWSVERGSGRL